MPEVATHGDALRVQSSSVEVKSLATVGTVPGVAVLAAGGKNGEGVGHLRISEAGTLLSYKAPGSSTFGSGQPVLTDGTYLVEDGEDIDKWLRVQVSVEHLPPAEREAPVHFGDIYENGIVNDDVSAAEASAGLIETYQLTLANDSNAILSQLKAWLKPDSSNYIEISEDNVAFVSPKCEADALDFPDLAVSGTDILYVKRTIVAGEQARASMLNCLEFSFYGL